MAGRKKHAAHENHERWLVSYADFITLMFAFFVVMFASSQADKQKLREVSENIAGALKHGRTLEALKRPPAPGDSRTQGLQNLHPAPGVPTAELTPTLQ